MHSNFATFNIFRKQIEKSCSFSEKPKLFYAMDLNFPLLLKTSWFELPCAADFVYFGDNYFWKSESDFFRTLTIGK